MGKATGIVEVFGLTAAFVAVDAGCKAANVTVETLDKTNEVRLCGGIAQLARAFGSYPECRRFKSHCRYQLSKIKSA